jgi:hypothetical protein
MNYERVLKDRIRHADNAELERLHLLYPNSQSLTSAVSKEQSRRKDRLRPLNPYSTK